MRNPGRLRGGGSHHPPAKPIASAATTAEPVSGPAAVAAIMANWKTVFNGKAPIPRRLALVQGGPQVAAFVQAQAKTSFGAAATGSTATVASVTITSPSQATVHYDVLLGLSRMSARTPASIAGQSCPQPGRATSRR
jgi:hypothetical protein